MEVQKNFAASGETLHIFIYGLGGTLHPPFTDGKPALFLGHFLRIWGLQNFFNPIWGIPPPPPLTDGFRKMVFETFPNLRVAVES